MNTETVPKLFLIRCLLYFSFLAGISTPLNAMDHAIGADLSFLKQAEDDGFVFKDGNASKSGLQIFKDHGYNWIRLRLFHTPTRLPNDLAYNCESAEYRDKPAPFPETPEGQRQFLEEVHRLVLNTPHNRGKGVFWWEPATQQGGHRTMFDPNGQAMPVLEVFDKFTRH